MLYMKVVKSVYPEFSSQGKKNFFSFLLYLYEMMEVH